MKFYINNNELSEKVFWRTLESLVSPMQRVHILDGRIPHCLLLEIFTNKGIGTAILKDGDEMYSNK